MPEKTSGWELFGKISAILAVAATVITIWNYIFPHAEDVEVTGYFQSYALPPNLTKMLEEVKDKEDYREIRKYLQSKQKTSKNKLNEEQISEASSLIEELFKQSWDEDFRYRFQKYSGFIYLTVRNTGSKTAEKVIIDLPANGVALITNQDDSQKSIKFNKKIELDDIRPNNSTNIAIWSEEKIGLYYEDDFSLSHANGVGDFSFGKTVYGFSRFIDEQAWLLIWIFGMLIPYVVISLIWTPSSSKKRDENSKAENEEQETKESNNAPNKDAQ